MRDELSSGVSIGRELRQTAESLMARAQEIIEKSGENPQTMHEIGRLMVEASESGVLDDLIDALPREREVSVDVLAQHPDGPNLSLYWMNGWISPPSSDVHWHNYWQAWLVMRGSWKDTVWQPVADVSDGVARDVEVDRREVLRAGHVQVLGPDEPHGWTAEERRRADGVVLLMWSGCSKGMPRVDLQPETGELTEAHGFLNPEPGA